MNDKNNKKHCHFILQNILQIVLENSTNFTYLLSKCPKNLVDKDILIFKVTKSRYLEKYKYNKNMENGKFRQTKHNWPNQ